MGTIAGHRLHPLGDPLGDVGETLVGLFLSQGAVGNLLSQIGFRRGHETVNQLLEGELVAVGGRVLGESGFTLFERCLDVLEGHPDHAGQGLLALDLPGFPLGHLLGTLGLSNRLDLRLASS